MGQGRLRPIGLAVVACLLGIAVQPVAEQAAAADPVQSGLLPKTFHLAFTAGAFSGEASGEAISDPQCTSVTVQCYQSSSISGAFTRGSYANLPLDCTTSDTRESIPVDDGLVTVYVYLASMQLYVSMRASSAAPAPVVCPPPLGTFPSAPGSFITDQFNTDAPFSYSATTVTGPLTGQLVLPKPLSLAGAVSGTFTLEWDPCNRSTSLSACGQKYVALGDSYSAGEGAVTGDPSTTHPNGDYQPGTDVWTDASHVTNVCHRSKNAYPAKLASLLGFDAEHFKSVACSGGVLSNFWYRRTFEANEGAQISAIAPPGVSDPDISLVSFTIGGNDAHFAPVLDACVYAKFLHSDEKCTKEAVTSLVDAGLKILSGPTLGLAGALSEIHARAPNARILVGGYPHLFADQPAKQGKPCVIGRVLKVPLFKKAHLVTIKVKSKSMALLNDAVDQVNAAISSIVASAAGINARYVDATKAFRNRGPCEDATNPLIRGLVGAVEQTPDPFNWSFHPTIAGQAKYAQLFSSASHS